VHMQAIFQTILAFEVMIYKCYLGTW